MATTTGPQVRQLTELVRLIRSAEGFPEVVAVLREGQGATIDGAWGSSCALAAAALGFEAPKLVVSVTSHLADVDHFADDLTTFCGVRPTIFPAWEGPPREQLLADEVAAQRLRVLKSLLSLTDPASRRREPPGYTPTQPCPAHRVSVGTTDEEPSSLRWVVTSIQSLLQPVPGRDQLEQSTRVLRVGDALEVDAFLGWLLDAGLRRVSTVEMPGEFAMHGGIVDVYPLDARYPVRIELFGEEVESLRRFDVESQRSLERLESVAITRLAGSDVDHLAGVHLCDYLPNDAWFALLEPAEIRDQGRHWLERLDDPRGMFNVEGALQHILRFPTVSIHRLATQTEGPTCRLRVESVERFSGDVRKVQPELEAAAGSQEVFLACHNDAEKNRLREILGNSELARSGRLHLCVGTVRTGFRLVDAGVVVLSDHQLFQRTELRRIPRRRYRGRPIESFLDLAEGDYVVHVSHGIARYRGLDLLQKRDGIEEHLVLEFAEQTKLYVPVSKIHLVQKYVGATRAVPSLSKIGTTTWQRRKHQAQQAVVDLASEMVELQAAREAQPGIAFASDTEWQREFEAAFPYPETSDQVSTAEEIKADMARPRPMDRLICGDVGYGKTELAMRAAFKAVDFGKQVAVLVPTTVLAEQHYRTFRERMAEYPIEIAALSRFKTKAEQREILGRMKAGTVDVVIGTHRLLQDDVELHDLGLIIIDEEQRFGVEHKERLKSLRTSVDVLTLSATPIPRTLHMALLGIRDISNLETPPQDRLAIETRICRFDPAMIRHAVLRELNRNGQIYFVHNRVETIEQVAGQLQAIVPEAILTVAHGQMPEHQLEQSMVDFVNRRSDVLVCTTIIESGLDIPNVNTIFINWADRYGLADLHQLRGRVGRYKHRAYCYLLLDPKKPITSKAAARLKAVEEFSELGAGFHIALRDLEIRGAGNLLGTQQSGHIAAVGYELYCQLLENAVRRLRGQPVRSVVEVSVDLPWPAYLPHDYVPDVRQKIALYRRLARLEQRGELEEFRQELEDRFGPLPPPTRNLLANTELRLLARPWQVAAIYLERDYLVLRYRNTRLIHKLRRKSGNRLRIADVHSAYLPVAHSGRSSRVEGPEPALDPRPWTLDQHGRVARVAASQAHSTAGVAHLAAGARFPSSGEAEKVEALYRRAKSLLQPS